MCKGMTETFPCMAHSGSGALSLPPQRPDIWRLLSPASTWRGSLSPWHQRPSLCPSPSAAPAGRARSPGPEPGSAAPALPRSAGSSGAAPGSPSSRPPAAPGAAPRTALRSTNARSGRLGGTQGGGNGKISGLERDRIMTGAARLHQPAMARFERPHEAAPARASLSISLISRS